MLKHFVLVRWHVDFTTPLPRQRAMYYSALVTKGEDQTKLDITDVHEWLPFDFLFTFSYFPDYIVSAFL